MRPYVSLWVLVGLEAFLCIPMGSNGSLLVLMGSYGSL